MELLMKAVLNKFLLTRKKELSIFNHVFKPGIGGRSLEGQNY